MDYIIAKSDKYTDKADYHLMGIFADKKTNHIDKKLSKSIINSIKDSIKNNEISGEVGDYQIFDDNNDISKIVVFGLGEKEKFNPIILNKTVSLVIKKVAKTSAKTFSINTINIVSSNLKTSAEQLIIAIESSFYKFSIKKIEDKTKLKKCIFLSNKAISIKDFNNIVKISKSISGGISLAKDLGNTPPNICTPLFLSNEAKKLQKINKSIKVKVLDEKKMKSLGMGSLLSVSQGSKQPAKFVIIEYLPQKNKNPIVLVGKGITFDTGGISLKPASTMDEMKFDMSGAGSVIGTMFACAKMQSKTNVVGILACAENMPGSQASRPGDVVTSMSGLTIEILNTDAEGRLVLCDALTYAKRYKPKYTLDMATLTGACLVGLGKYPSGLFSNDQKLADLIKKSADKTGDRVWQLPLYDDYFLELKTNFADIQNIGGRYGGAITAAAFLAKFTEDIKWAHLDIAGTAWETGENKGSTGRPVGLLVDFLLSNQ
jgi:leucyl aminopeptidase